MNPLSTYWPWALGGVVSLALMILMALVQLLRKGMNVKQVGQAKPKVKIALPEAAPIPDYKRLGTVFRRARALFRERGNGDRYKTPLVVVMGAEGSREAGFLHRALGRGLEPLDDPADGGLAFASGRELLFFDKGAVLDVAGEPVLGSDGQHADDATWNRIMRGLVELRPKRPVDAVVLTIGSGELLHAATNEPARLELAERAARVRARLWDLQEKTGFRLPLYVLVTNCEEVSNGFAETCAALDNPLMPPQILGQMLGWSSPHGKLVPYQSTWIDRTFSELRTALGDLQMELFRFGPQSERPGVMLFPWQIAALAEPLRTVLDRLLSPGARHEGPITRGIYFCGKVSEGQTGTAFVADLFAQKIFPEAALATPTSAVRITRSRRARAVHFATAAVATVLSAGLVIAAFLLPHRHDVMLPILRDALADITAMSTTSTTQRSEAAARFLDRLALVDFDTFGPWWIPASWITGFNGRLHQALGYSFETIVFRAVYDHLDERAGRLINDASMHARAADTGPSVPTPAESVDAQLDEEPIEALEKMQEFIRLQAFVKDMAELEAQGETFNRVAATGGDVQSLGAVVKYTFGRTLNPRFFGRAKMYESFVRSLETQLRFKPDDYSEGAGAGAVQEARNLYAHLYARNPCARRVGVIARLIDPNALQLPERDEIDTVRFQRLDLALDTVQKDLSTPALEWAFNPAFDLGRPFNDVLGMMDRSKFFRRVDTETVRREGRSGLSALQQQLAVRTGLGTTVLKVRADQTPVMELSVDSVVIHTAVEGFLGQPFMTRQAELFRIRRPTSRERLIWDLNQIEEAAIVFRAYRDFRERGLKLFPANVAGAIDQTARQHTRTQMAERLAWAQRFEQAAPDTTAPAHEEDVRIAALAFDGSSKALRNQLDALQALGDLGTRNDVIAANSAEGARLLYSVDTLLNASAPYRAQSGNVDWWEGTAAPAPAACGVHDPAELEGLEVSRSRALSNGYATPMLAWGAHDAAELAEYLQASRARVTALSRDYAAPMMAWFSSFRPPLPDAAVVDRWQTIGNDLQNLETKKPGNAPALLEDYIALRAAKLTPADCRAAELTPAESPARGYFGDRLKENAALLGARCRIVAAERAADRYDTLSRLFNQRLAGRYPFSDQPPKSGDVEADPEDVRRFYACFDESRPLFNAVTGDGAPGWFVPGYTFVGDMVKVRRFFAAFLKAEKPRLPEVNVETEFRTVAEREVGANEIITWALTVGNSTSTQREGKKLPWRPGTPVRLTLQWAANGPRVPVLPAEQRNAAIEDRSVVYRYTNRWSLLAALDDLRADLPGSDDHPPVTLAMNVLTRPAAGGAPDPLHPSILYLRMALSGTDGQPLEVPAFPRAAPAIKRLTVEVMP